MRLSSELETAVWVLSWSVYGPFLRDELAEALAEYRRRPGFDETARLHVNTAGPGLAVLADVLSQHAAPGMYSLHREYIEIRSRLHWHIVRSLQRRLVTQGYASSEIRDDFFATDLGL